LEIAGAAAASRAAIDSLQTREVTAKLDRNINLVFSETTSP
jgi:hypothetical protein